MGVEKDASGNYKPWGAGPRGFLRKLYEKKYINYKNFFNDVLEPLFYQALAIDRGKVSEFTQFKCKIPFLNGGLFEPIGGYSWEETDILIKNETFAEILHTFDLYNFTVREDEPLEKEVAVDPEMLGKVFENLLEVKDRKSKGTYYTPREIVHYMCQESLINYLDTALNTHQEPFVKQRPVQQKLLGNPDPEQLGLTMSDYKPTVPKEDIEEFIRKGELIIQHDMRVINEGKETKTYPLRLPEFIRENAERIDDTLASMKICDPAVGSGAFLVGMMQEIIKAREILTTYVGESPERTAYNFKRHCIQESIYGVDIDPSAVDIAKLRLWLSLVVDEEDFESIKPLPNLEYKVVCGNSLLGVEKDLFNEQLFKILETLKSQYFEETNPRKKDELKRKIDSLIKQITNNDKHFDFHVYFSEVFHKTGGFDVVIGNPPYGAKMEEDELEKIKEKLKDTDNSNSAALFIDFGKNKLINKNGTLSFIVPKSLLYSERWFSLVKALLGKVMALVDVEKAFEKVKLEQIVFIYGNSIQTKSYIAMKFLNSEFIRSTNIQNDLVLKYKAWLCDVTEEELILVESLKTKYVYMNNISVTRRGVGLQKYLSNKGEYPVIGGKNIYRYGYDGIKGYLSERVIKANRRKLGFIQQPKIISQRLVAHVTNPLPRIIIMSAFDQDGNILNIDTVENTVLLNSQYDYKYILAILNSTFTSWYAYKFIFCSAIRTMDFDNYYVGKIIAPAISKEEQEPFIELVDKILSITKNDEYLENPLMQAQVKEYERQIDRMVYELYGLTEEEIRIVEGKEGEN